jgi:hypothetical protein
MAQSELEAWVGKVVQLRVAGERYPWLGVLEGWDERGMIIRYTEDMVRFAAETQAGEGPSKPIMLLFPWTAALYVGIELENLEDI